MTTAIKIEGLVKKYKQHAVVDNLSLEIYKGELFALLGVNGAGKTTTIKMLSGLTTPTSGDAFLHGNSVVKNTAAVKKIINVSPQETAVARNLTVLENLVMTAQIYGFNRNEAKKKAEEMLQAFALDEYRRSKAKTLSGGTARRLSIAMALISEPEILFLDEPTLGLDVIARRELWHEIEKLKRKITIILTTHYMEEAQALSDRIAIMTRGKLRACATASELMKKTGASSFEDAFVKIAEGSEEK